MDEIVLGRTGLTVSVAGLGCGGHSRLGQGQGKSVAESVALVRGALDLGITYFDTAAGYGTEAIVGEALEGAGEEVVVSTKAMIRPRGGELIAVSALRSSIEHSLRTLRREAIDVFHLHGVLPGDYDRAVSDFLPLLEELRTTGVIRFVALSEDFVADRAHEMLVRAIGDGWFDVVMVGHNVLNPTARETVFPAAAKADVGVEVMYAVRNALSRPEVLASAITEAIAAGALAPDALDTDDPLGFLVHPGGATSLLDAAYRFARHEPAGAVVLTGTGSLEHLDANVASITAAPLPQEDLARLDTVFGGCTFFTGN